MSKYPCDVICVRHNARCNQPHVVEHISDKATLKKEGIEYFKTHMHTEIQGLTGRFFSNWKCIWNDSQKAEEFIYAEEFSRVKRKRIIEVDE